MHRLIRQQHVWTSSQRNLLLRVRDIVHQQDRGTIDKAIRHLQELFLVVIVGEFNSGKSSVVNALLGREVCKVGVTPTTADVHLIKQSEEEEEKEEKEEGGNWLKHAYLVDTPGTNAVVKGHQEITEEFVPRADLVMFVTSVDRPISESEAVFLGKIAQWDKKIAVILNKKDHLSDGTNELSRVLEFLKSNVCKILESEPPIFPISAKEGMKAKLLIAKDDTIEEGKVLLKKSGLKDLEDYIERILSNEEKIILKLKTPLGVASHILNKHKIECEELRQGVLSEDVETLKNIEERMRAFNEELERDFKYQLSQIDNVLLRMLDRCDEFLTDQMRIGNLVGIIKNSKLSDQFEKFVVKDFTSEIEELISGTSAWLMDKNSILAQHVTSYILRRSEKHANMIGNVGGAFFSSKQNVLQDLQRSAKKATSEFDQRKALSEISSTMRASVIQTLVFQASAFGLGSYAISAGAAASVDFTGLSNALAGAGILALTGLYIIPYQRVRLKSRFRENITRVRKLIDSTLNEYFQREKELSSRQIRDSFAPYSQFVESSISRAEETTLRCEELLKEIDSIMSEIVAVEQEILKSPTPPSFTEPKPSPS